MLFSLQPSKAFISFPKKGQDGTPAPSGRVWPGASRRCAEPEFHARATLARVARGTVARPTRRIREGWRRLAREAHLSQTSIPEHPCGGCAVRRGGRSVADGPLAPPGSPERLGLLAPLRGSRSHTNGARSRDRQRFASECRGGSPVSGRNGRGGAAPRRCGELGSLSFFQDWEPLPHSPAQLRTHYHAKGKKKGRGKSRGKKQKKPEVDILSPAAMLNLYYIAHNVADCLQLRGFRWPGAAKTKKGKGKT
ncbi:PREDICTED: small lysine-rich protein 1 [Bison bison bison]|uniref:Small lysine-rich protein 1 n=1 Tax=Bison bison bison TaxID=43346 RepID=A0A6P3GUI1_BISBB|nr:PREDICTED: small lysine-rich protein 1 [Bison bison bison]